MLIVWFIILLYPLNWEYVTNISYSTEVQHTIETMISAVAAQRHGFVGEINYFQLQPKAMPLSFSSDVLMK